MGKLKILTAFRAACGLTALATLVACGGVGDDQAVERQTPLVEAVAARTGTLPLQATISGVARARNQVTIRSEISGVVAEVLAESGQAVDRGLALVRLHDDELRDQLRQAEAGTRVAEAAAAEARARVAELAARVERTRVLVVDELVSAQEVETQEARLAALEASAELAAARVEQAEATTAERRSALAKTVVRSAVAGRVGQRRVEVGTRIDPDDVLFVVGNLDQIVIEVPLTERMMDQVETGMPVIVEPRKSGGEPIRAALSRVSPFLAEESFTTVGEIDVDNRNGQLRPGNYLTVHILYGESRRATLVPASAVWEDPGSGRRGVFAVESAAGLMPPGEGSSGSSGVAEADDEPPQSSDESRAIIFRPVEILAEGQGTMGVDGVRDGEWVVVIGQHMLREQARDEQRQDGAQSAGGPLTARARVRPISWQRVQELQGLTREDLLAGFLDKQQKVAAALGAEIPDSEAAVDRVLEQAKQSAADAGGG